MEFKPRGAVYLRQKLMRYADLRVLFLKSGNFDLDKLKVGGFVYLLFGFGENVVDVIYASVASHREAEAVCVVGTLKALFVIIY